MTRNKYLGHTWSTTALSFSPTLPDQQMTPGWEDCFPASPALGTLVVGKWVELSGLACIRLQAQATNGKHMHSTQRSVRSIPDVVLAAAC